MIDASRFGAIDHASFAHYRKRSEALPASSTREIPLTVAEYLSADGHPGTYAGKTGDEWRAEAARCRKQSAESWERSDTDGFMSQWASDSIARECDAKARVADEGGTCEAWALFYLDGTVASLDERDGQYGPYWILNDRAAALFGKRFFNGSRANKSATRRANNRKKGFTLGRVRIAAHVTLAGSGYALSVSVRPDRDAIRNGEYTVISVDDDPTDY
jgi:hypothetical protein